MQKMLINLPPEASPYAEDIRQFVDAMIFKLVKNAHKGKWQETSVDEALSRARAECDELEEAIGRGNMVEIVLEAADVANFALIAASMAINGRTR